MGTTFGSQLTAATRERENKNKNQTTFLCVFLFSLQFGLKTVPVDALVATMVDSEKLTALKKAYAEIILNTAKEAAARIMVSEKKAHRYQMELFAAKDESLHMLIRLKHMLDAKVNEAEMTSLNQQKRIEELEAQLGEAEDIVRDLRAELRETQDELEKLTKNSVRCSDEQKSEHGVAACEKLSNGNTISNFGSVVSSQLDTQTNVVTVSDIKSSTNVGSKCSCKDNCYVCNPDFASIVMRRKEPDLYRNGCTQRIRALERSLLNENLSPSGQVDDAKNEDTRKDEEGRGMQATISRPEEKIDELKVMQTDVLNIVQALPVSPLRRKRKRAARYKKNRVSSSMVMRDQVVTRQKSDLCAESFSHAAAPKGCSSLSIPGSPSSAVKVVAESRYEKVDKDDFAFVKACDLHNDKDGNKLLTDEKDLTRPVNLDVEMVDVAAVNLDVKVSEVTEGSSPQPINNKFLMYTFKRKRKKDSLSSPDRDCSLDKDTSKRKMEDKRNGSLDSGKSTLPAESSRDSRRLAQVARQLISLSEKKWR
ncbi:hypothetical protein HRI_004167000 [Hibiscus trionum]|uniref:Uncharacterized protein n=1 Tax=Hibiscus trionum TaxID=183268 RepID=A0A9W7J218_HIBTR|nr:hypothetical protein HRI_004167000 [Hibiscus trionum]